MDRPVIRAGVAAATGLVALGLLTGCGRTTEGMVAQTTEPGPPLSSAPSRPGSPGLPTFPGLPEITIPNFPMPGQQPDVPDVPAPPNALTMKCTEFNKLDAATKKAVVNAILEGEQSILGPENVDIARSLAEAVCQFLTGATVREVLLGGPVP